MKRLLLVILWLPITLLTLIMSLYFFAYHTQSLKNEVLAKEKLNQIAYSDLMTILGEATQSAAIQESAKIINDTKVKIISQYLKKYQSPMLENSQALVNSANNYNIDPFLIVAIAQCETNLGKKSPEGCYNPFGLGIYSQKMLCFNNWEESFELMAKILRNKYHNQGLNTPEDIMIKYCPNSLEKDGQWAKCVSHFIEDLKKMEAESKSL